MIRAGYGKRQLTARLGGVTFADEVQLAAAVVGGIVGGQAIWLLAQDRWRKTWGSRADLTRRIDHLAAGLPAAYVEKLFGIPILQQHDYPSGNSHSGVTQNLYFLEHCWLEVFLSAPDGQVVGFTVVVTDPKFRFDTSLLTFGTVKVQLGRSKFSEIGSAGSIRWITGAHIEQWAEMYYGANPGGYQHFCFANNDLGVGQRVPPRGHGYVDGKFMEPSSTTEADERSAHPDSTSCGKAL